MKKIDKIKNLLDEIYGYDYQINVIKMRSSWYSFYNPYFIRLIPYEKSFYYESHTIIFRCNKLFSYETQLLETLLDEMSRGYTG